MTPAAKIVGILQENVDSFPDILTDNICTYMIGENNVDNQHVILVVSEDSAGSHEFGNDLVIGTIRRISIQFYYPKNYEKDMDLIEKSVESFLRTKRIKCYLNAGHVMTPDSQNITNTLKFNYLETEEQ